MSTTRAARRVSPALSNSIPQNRRAATPAKTVRKMSSAAESIVVGPQVALNGIAVAHEVPTVIVDAQMMMNGRRAGGARARGGPDGLD